LTELEWIETFITPRSGQHEAGQLGPGDDAALSPPLGGDRAVLTVDALVEGQHFLDHWLDDQTLARRVIRSCVSDLAAMGATPIGFLLSVESAKLPGRLGDQFWLAIDEECRALDVQLLGGNVTRSDGPLSIHCTFLGRVTAGREWRRSGARGGDLLVVTGDPGHASRAMQEISWGLLPAADDRWSEPIPRVDLAVALAAVAPTDSIVTAAIDISDGLLLDLRRLCKASGCAANIDIDDLVTEEISKQMVLAGGEDYELLLAIDAASMAHFEEIASEQETDWHLLGTIENGNAGEVAVKIGGQTLASDELGGEISGGWDPFDLQH